MPAETKRVQPGIYLMFLGKTVTEEDLAQQVQRLRDAADRDAVTDPVLVLDAVLLYNPLQAARLLPKHIDGVFTHVVTVADNRNGAVLTERLAQQLSGVTIAVYGTQPEALAHARALRGAQSTDDLHCDYL